MEDVKSELKQENYEKKQIGHSASKKVGRRKKISMPFEMMSKEERRKYMAPSEVTTYRMEPMTLGELRQVPYDRQVDLLKWYGEKYGWTNTALAEVLSVSRPTATKVLAEFNLKGVYSSRLTVCTSEQRKEQKDRLNDLLCQRRSQAASKSPQSAPKEENPTTPEENKKPSQANLAATRDLFMVALKSKKVTGASLAGYLRGIAESLDTDRDYQVSLSVQFSDGDQRISDVEET